MKSVIIIAIVAVAMIGVMVPSVFAYTITDDATGGDCSTIGTWDSASKTCTLSGDLTEGITIGSNYLTLDGNNFSITGNNPYYIEDPNSSFGIYFDTKANVLIKNILIQNFHYGVYANAVATSTIQNSEFANNVKSQIFFEYSIQNTISNNLVTCDNDSYAGGDDGINVYFGENNSVLENTITNCKSEGISFIAEKNMDIKDNFVTMKMTEDLDSFGISVDSGNWNENYKVNVVDNTVKNSKYGMMISAGENSIIRDNLISENISGLSASGSSFEITGNIISNNEKGISLTSGSNQFFHNNLISNDVDGSGVWNHGGNYWGNVSPNCNDNDNDNLCDDPHPLKDISNIFDDIWIVQDGWKTTINTSDLSLESASPSGTIGTYSVSATHDGNSMPVSCDIPSGSVFSIGSTSVVCTTQNGIHSTFTVTTNLETTPPVVTVPSDIIFNLQNNSTETSIDFTVSANDNYAVTVGPVCDVESGSVFQIGTVNITCNAQDAAGNVGTNTFSVTVNPPPPIISSTSPPTESNTTVEGNNLDSKIFASGNVQYLIDGINTVSTTWKDTNGVTVYQANLQIDASGNFNNEFDNPMYVRDMKDSGLYTTTVTYDDVTTQYTWNYLTSVYVPEPDDGPFTLPCSMQENGDGVWSSSCNGFYSNGIARAEVGINYGQGILPIQNYQAVGFFIDENGTQGSNITVNYNLINPDESATLVFENTESGFVSEFQMQMLGGELVVEEPTPDSITVTSSNSSYNEGDTIHVYGNVSLDENNLVQIQVIAPDGNILNIQQLTPDSSGNYSFTLNSGGPLMVSGEYQIRAQYGSLASTNTFMYTAASPVVTPPTNPIPTNTIGAVEESGFSQVCVETGCYTPVTAVVNYGDTVTMTNSDPTGVHTFTSGTVNGFTPSSDGTFDSGVLMSGDSFQWQANVSGEVPYYCMLHTWMVGTIVVQGSGPVVVPEPVVEPNSNFRLSLDLSGMNVLDVEEDNDSKSLVFSVNVIDDTGILKVTFPRSNFDSVNEGFFILVDGNESIFSATQTSSQRTVTVELPIGSEEVEIIGSKLIGTVSNNFPTYGTHIPPTPEPEPVPEPTPLVNLNILWLAQSYDLGDLVSFSISGNNVSGTQKVSVDVTDPIGNTVVSRSIDISEGIHGEIEFRLSENFKTGTYKITATTSDNGQIISETSNFKLKSQFNSFTISDVMVSDQQGNSSTLQSGEMGFIKVNLSSTKSIATLVTVNLFDAELTSIGIGSVQTTLASGESEIILSFMIPEDAAIGPADIYVNAFSDWPSSGGTALTGELSSMENIS